MTRMIIIGLLCSVGVMYGMLTAQSRAINGPLKKSEPVHVTVPLETKTFEHESNYLRQGCVNGDGFYKTFTACADACGSCMFLPSGASSQSVNCRACIRLQ